MSMVGASVNRKEEPFRSFAFLCHDTCLNMLILSNLANQAAARAQCYTVAMNAVALRTSLTTSGLSLGTGGSRH